MNKSAMLTLTEILDWVWQIEVGSEKRTDSKPVDELTKEIQ